eukprot:gene5071-3657_t
MKQARNSYVEEFEGQVCKMCDSCKPIERLAFTNAYTAPRAFFPPRHLYLLKSLDIVLNTFTSKWNFSVERFNRLFLAAGGRSVPTAGEALQVQIQVQEPPAPPALSSAAVGIGSKPSGMSLSLMQHVKSAEMFNAAVAKLKEGDIEGAILLLQEAEFFSPEDPTPLVAHAECFVYLCDMQSAIRYYRRALWVVQKRDKIDPTCTQPATILPTQNFSSVIPPIASSSISNTKEADSPRGVEVTGRQEDSTSLVQMRRPTRTLLLDHELLEKDMGFESPLASTHEQKGPMEQNEVLVPFIAAENAEKDREGDDAPLTTSAEMHPPYSPDLHFSEADVCRDLAPALFSESAADGMQSSASMWQYSRTQRMQKGGNEIQLADIQRRLAGLLDAMSLALFNMSDFVAALQAAEDSLALVDDSVVQLHRCVYLISLQREEEAEMLLETHMKKHEGSCIQTSALLIQLYVNRQAFRPARMLLDKYTGTTRYEDCLTIARHIFYLKYERYRSKALEKKDVGTISKCIDVFPNDVELLFARAKIRITEGDHKKSVKDLFRCVKETNGTHKEAIETMTSVLFTIGTSLDGEEGIQEAIVYYSESLKWRSDNALVLLARADCYVKLEAYEDALIDYRRILQINPDDPIASKRIAFLHDLWGRKLYRQGLVKDAEIEFTNAIKECDTEPLFYYHRALCRFNLDEARYGLRDVLSCQQLKPTDSKIKAFVVRYLGTNDVPDTTKSFKQAEMNQLVVKDVERGTSHLTHRNDPPSSSVTKKRAAKYYGQPSARITKVLVEAQEASEAVGRGAMPMEKVIGAVHGATSREHIGFVDFVCGNAPEGSLTVVSGSRTKLVSREPRRQGHVQKQLRGTKLPSIARKRDGTANPSSVIRVMGPPTSTSRGLPQPPAHTPGMNSKLGDGIILTGRSDLEFSSEVKVSSADSARTGRPPMEMEDTMPIQDSDSQTPDN